MVILSSSQVAVSYQPVSFPRDSISAIVIDIEGTMGRVTYVKETMYPYAQKHLESFLSKNEQSEKVSKAIQAVKDEMKRPNASLDEVIGTLQQWILDDLQFNQKHASLKTIQGFIWEAGFREGTLQSHIYEEVKNSLEKWDQAGIPLYIYSSGSAQAQIAYFKHTSDGDLSSLFKGHFDLNNIGSKIEKGSYEKIGAQIGISAGQILFLSDLEAELKAAEGAGMKTILLCRENTTPSAQSPFQAVSSFDQILIEDGSIDKAKKEIIEAGRFLNEEGLCRATGGNISVRLGDDIIAITATGKHKGHLTSDDVLLVDSKGNPKDPNKKPSAETLLHTLIYSLFKDAKAVLHYHSPTGTVLSKVMGREKAMVTEGYEIHKVFPNIKTHESKITIPIFDNSQDYPALAKEIKAYLIEHPETFAFILRGHGINVWGANMAQTKIFCEAIELLLHCEWELRKSMRNC